MIKLLVLNKQAHRNSPVLPGNLFAKKNENTNNVLAIEPMHNKLILFRILSFFGVPVSRRRDCPRLLFIDSCSTIDSWLSTCPGLKGFLRSLSAADY